MAGGQLSKKELFERTDASELNNEDDFLTVLTEVKPLSTKAVDLGIALGLSYAELSKDIDLKEVIKKWLDQSYDVDKHGLPSYRALVYAVDSDVGGNNPRIAKKIAKNHQVEVMDVQESAVSLPTPVRETAGRTQRQPSPFMQPTVLGVPESGVSFHAPVCETAGRMQEQSSSIVQPTDHVQEDSRESLGIAQLAAATVSSSPHDSLAFSPSATQAPTSVSHTTESDGFPDIRAFFSRRRRQFPPKLAPYEMNKDPHGLVLIINNINFRQHKARAGADVDGEKLATVFTKLRYSLYRNRIHVNCSKGEMEELLKSVAQVDHSQYDSFICCILSHGKLDVVYGTDEFQLTMEEIRKPIINCETLVGKPKIFFLQACRGLDSPEGRYIQTDGDGDNRIFLPHDNDVFFGFSTTPDTRSCRFTDIGSWYVIELCKSLEAHHRELDFVSMVTAAHYEVATNPEYVLERPDRYGMMKKYKQSPQIVSTLIRPVYF